MKFIQTLGIVSSLGSRFIVDTNVIVRKRTEKKRESDSLNTLDSIYYKETLATNDRQFFRKEPGFSSFYFSLPRPEPIPDDVTDLTGVTSFFVAEGS